MSLDPQGFILTLPFADVQPAFQAVIDDALAHRALTIGIACTAFIFTAA